MKLSDVSEAGSDGLQNEDSVSATDSKHIADENNTDHMTGNVDKEMKQRDGHREDTCDPEFEASHTSSTKHNAEVNSSGTKQRQM